MEEQRDVIHGGVIMKTVVQNAKLKQCNRCVCVCVTEVDRWRCVCVGGGGALVVCGCIA